MKVLPNNVDSISNESLILDAQVWITFSRRNYPDSNWNDTIFSKRTVKQEERRCVINRFE